MPNSDKANNFGGGPNADVQKRVGLAAEVFDKYGDEIRSIILFNVRDEARADDIFQDFFLSIVNKPIPPDIQDIRGYLYKAITNDIVDAARKIKSHRDRIQRYADRHRYDIEQKGPQSTVMAAEEVGKMFDLIESRLPRCEAEAFSQRYEYDRDTDAAAKKMGIKKRSFARYLCVGLKKVREILRENEGDK
jgi:RNA polymerase sigma factor (sigma-70 family)